MLLTQSLENTKQQRESKPEIDSRHEAVTTLHPSKFSILSLCKPAMHKRRPIN